MTFFDILHYYALKEPDTVLYSDELYGDYTYAWLEEASARIYAYLSERHIGREHIVAIRMKRSARIFLVMLGVWKCGAAFTAIGEHSPDDYVNRTLKDTEPVLVFDDACFENAMTYAPKEGYQTADPHDLACVVYSTGSSGVFKGSMHEFGAIQKVINWYETPFVCRSLSFVCRSLFGSGFYAINAITILITSVIGKMFQYIVPYEKISDEAEIMKLLAEKKCTYQTTSPKMVHCIGTSLPDLKVVYSTFDLMSFNEERNAVVYNSYGLTESFGNIVHFMIDKKYDIVPIGKPIEGFNVQILDRNDAPTAPNVIGTICFTTEFFRGYIKQPELTKKSYYNGWFHTGDMGYTDERGNIVFLGRKIDILETEKGHIIPSLILVQIKKKMSVRKCFVKLFGDAKSYKVCVYYCGDVEYTPADFRQQLDGALPDYMMPTHFVKLDDFPYFPSGKINRLAFQEPADTPNA